MVKKKIIVLGGGGHAKVIMGMILRREKEYNLLGFLDDNQEIKELFGKPNLGKLTDPPKLETRLLGLGLGHLGNNSFRKKIIEIYESKGYEFESIIDISAVVMPNVELGKGLFLGPGAIINSYSKIGDYSILNTNSSVDHDGVIGNHVHIAPGVAISGNVIIGDYSFIGVGATIIHGITIGEKCKIGAGAVVIKNCEPNKTYIGVPAKVKIKEKVDTNV